MPTRYNTGNPIESTDVRDMSDNAKNFDLFSGSELDTFVDRLGETRLTIEGAIEKSGFKPGSGDFATGFTVMPGMRNISWKNPSPPGDNNFYSWDGPIPPTGKFVPAGSTPETTGGVIAGAWRPRTDEILRDELAHIGGVGLVGGTPVTVTNPAYAGGAKPDGTTLNDAAFLAAEASAGASPIYVPVGVYRLSTPMIHGYTAKYYGPGVLKYDNAEWWRRGGSSGSVSVPERYTIFYDFNSQSDVTLTFDGVPQPFSWVGDRTIEAAGTAITVSVKINVANGYLGLGPVAELVRSYNIFGNGGGGQKINPSHPDPLTLPKGYDNTSFGARAMLDMLDGVNNTAYGSKALESNQSGVNNTALGFLTLYRSTGSGNTAVGSVAGEWVTTGQYNSLFGLGAGEKIKTGSYNVGLGFEAMAEAPASNYVVAVGYRANGNSGDYSQSNSVYVGAFAGDFSVGSNNTMVGYRAGNCLDAAPGTGTGHDNVGVGLFAMRKNLAGSESVVVGVGAAAESTSVSKSVVIGYGAGGSTPTLGAFSVVVGWNALPVASGDNNVAFGQQSQAATTTGGNNVSVGSGSLVTNSTGSNNTALGNNSGRLKQDGTGTVSLTNTTTVGNDARVSGDNQVQLGNGATTTYVYGTVQNRSDAEDKTDVRDTQLGIEFIMGLRPVDGRWDMRDDYLEEYQVQIGIDDNAEPVLETRSRQLPKDGSKARARFHHWFIAQEVKELCDKLGVDFGGYQDHSINGGCDVKTLGYDEFVPPTVKAVQQCWNRLDELERRIAALE